MMPCGGSLFGSVQRHDEPTALKIGNAAVFGVAAFFAVTAVVTGINYVKKYNSDEAKKRRLV
jgi:hypothetical protein